MMCSHENKMMESALTKAKKGLVIKWMQDEEKISATQAELNASWVKTIETLTAELNRCHRERGEFIRLIKDRVAEYDISEDEINEIARKCFK